MTRAGRLGPPLAVLCLILLLWDVYCRAAAVPPMLLPPPSAVLAALLAERAAIGPHAMATFGTTLLGFSLSVAASVGVSALLYLSPPAERALMPLLAASQTVPIVALAPLMILWFGFGLLPKVLLVILVTFFPMVVSLMAGYRAAPQGCVDVLRAMGAGPVAVFRRVRLPAARAAFFAGLRISGTYAVVATIFAEYAGARRGIGIYLMAAKNNFRADLVLAAVAVSAALTVLLLAGLGLIDRLTDPRRRRHAGA